MRDVWVSSHRSSRPPDDTREPGRHDQRSSGSLPARFAMVKPGAEPPNLAPVADLVFRDVKPGPVSIHLRHRSQWSFEPGVVAGGERPERGCARAREVVEVELQIAAPEVGAPLQSQIQAGGPGRFLLV